MLTEEQVKVKVKDNAGERFVLTVARNGQILSTTTNVDKAVALDKQTVDNIYVYTQKYNDKYENRKNKLSLEVV